MLPLGYVNVCKSISDHVDPEDRIALGQLRKGVTKRNPLFHKNEQESTIFLNEAGLYSLVLQSKLPFAREFKRWIVKDVLPNIRQMETIVCLILSNVSVDSYASR